MPTFINRRSRTHLLCERRPTRAESLFAGVLTGHSGEGEKTTETEDNEHVQTDVCGATKGVRIVDVEAWRGRGAERDVRRHLRPGRAAGGDRRGATLGGRGEGVR
jgi:hypothetical protein